MEEPVRQEPTEEKRTYFDRDRYSALSRAIWRDFGPLIMGALVLLVVLGGGWYLWSRSQQAPEETAVVIEENGQDISLPTSEITIPGAASPKPTPTPGASPSPSPSPSVSPKPSPSPSALAMANGTNGAKGQPASPAGGPQVTNGTTTKGGQLPKTGLPFAQIFLFSALPGLGLALHKLSKKI